MGVAMFMGSVPDGSGDVGQEGRVVRLDRMRSLLIMMGEDRMSRRLRPMETSVSLR